MSTNEDRLIEHEEEPKAYYNIRRPTFRENPLTLGIAFVCKDGIVIAADMQGTANFGRITSIDKTMVIENKSVVGFSYWSSDWNRLFQQLLRARQEPSHLERVKKAREDYAAHVLANKHLLSADELRPAIYGFDGILATEEDGEKKIYQFSHELPPTRDDTVDKIIIGSAYTTAEDYIQIAEFVAKLLRGGNWETLVWPMLKVEFAEAFSMLILENIHNHENSAQWGKIYVIKDGRARRRTRDDIYEGKDSLEVTGKKFLSQFTVDQLAIVAKRYHLTPAYVMGQFNLTYEQLMKILASLEETP